MASWNCSRKRISSMQVSSGRPHMLTSNQRGRGNEPVTVLGRIRLALAVNMGSSDRHCTSTHVRSGINAAAGGQPTVSPLVVLDRLMKKSLKDKSRVLSGTGLRLSCDTD